MSCTDRILHLKLPTLEYNRLHGDIIEVSKVTHDTYDPNVSLNLAYHSGTITRGNKYKLINHRFHYDLWKYYFSARIVNIWNSLMNHVVDVNNVNLLKAHLNWVELQIVLHMPRAVKPHTAELISNYLATDHRYGARACVSPSFCHYEITLRWRQCSMRNMPKNLMHSG